MVSNLLVNGLIQRRHNMSIFQPVTLTWKGNEYKIESNRVMMMLAQVEDVLTLGELIKHAQKGGAPVIKISMAYGIMLRYAGVKVVDDEVYKSLMTGKEANIKELTQMLLSMMMPPEDFPEEQKSNKSAEK